eukprot:2191826-Amphidinium_carterae.1
MASAGETTMPSAPGTTTGSFCVFSEPVTIASYAMLHIATEDGPQSLPMVGPDRAPASPTSSATSSESEDFIDGDGFTNGFELPPNIYTDESVLSPTEAIILFGDGGWWPKDKKWGIGI